MLTGLLRNEYVLILLKISGSFMVESLRMRRCREEVNVDEVWVEKSRESEVEEELEKLIEAGPTERFLFTLVALVADEATTAVKGRQRT
jgi:hypothetical protein